MNFCSYRKNSVLLFSFHFAGIEATSAHVLVVQIAFPFTSVLNFKFSLVSSVSHLLFFSLTNATRSLSSFKTVLYVHVFLTHVLPSNYKKEFVGKEVNKIKIN